MSEQTAIETYGDTLFGQGVEAALDVLGKTYELAFMKCLSQLSSPVAGEIVDRAGEIGVAREIASYKSSLALARSLTAAAVTDPDPDLRAVLEQLSSQFSDAAAEAGSRIINASAFADEQTTVEQAIAEIFQASDELVADLLAPTPGVDWSTHEIVDTAKAALATGASCDTLLADLESLGIGAASQSMTDLSLSLESYVGTNGSDDWGVIAAQAGGGALLLDALFRDGYAPALQVNDTVPFYQDQALADLVGGLLDSPSADSSMVSDYLPDVQVLAWLVHSIDPNFTSADLNILVDAAAASSNGNDGMRRLVADLQRIVSGGNISSGADSASFYRSVFATMDQVASAYPEGLTLESLASTSAAQITAAALQSDGEGVAYRYALTELNSFVLLGADYSSFNNQGQLDLYDASTGQGTFTADYLADRPQLLAAMVGANLADTLPDASGTTLVPGLTATLVDRDEGVRLTDPSNAQGLVLFDGETNAPILGTVGRDRLYGEAGDDTIDGGAGDDMLDGGQGNDTLYGADGNDTVMGGAGNDTLYGGAGHDLLFGGAGDDVLFGDGDGDILDGGTGKDTYHVRQGDVIRDEDGQGTVLFGADATLIGGGTQIEGSPLFVSGDATVVFRQNDDGSVDFWMDGQRVTVLPGLDTSGARSRTSDGAAVEDRSDADGGKPMLGLPLRRAEAPRDPSYKTPFMLAQAVPAPRRDPLVLDLDGDGVETLAQSAVTYFDHDGNGFAELTGWIGGDDGFLVLDRNGDGRINDGRELFGDRTVLASGAVATGGVQALAEWDLAILGGNGDGVIDANDSVWSSLRVWRDLDADGFSDADELFTLADLGVAAIDLSFAAVGSGDGLGNTQARAGSFTRTDGSTSTIAEYLLARDTTLSIAEATVPASDEIAALPEVRGSGNVYDLRQAMARNADLRDLVTAFVQENRSEARGALLTSILFRWGGAAAVDPNSRGGMIDARKLVVLERFLAEDFAGALGANPVPDAAIQLERAWHDLSEQVYAKLMEQSHLENLYQGITFRADAATGQVHADLSQAKSFIDSALAADFATGKSLLAEFGRMLRAMDEVSPTDYEQFRQSYAGTSDELAIAFDSGGLNFVSDVTGAVKLNGTTGADLLVATAGNDSVMGFDGDDVIYGMDGNDTLSGCEDNDQLFGGLGNDNLFGGLGNDLLDGGSGDDYLNGGLGNDAYVLARGGGLNRIVDYDATPGNYDVIRVNADILRSEVRYWRAGNDLYVGIGMSGDALLVTDWFAGAANQVEAVMFANGSTIDAAALAAAHYVGTDGADAMLGSGAADILEGLGGNDSIQGGAGDDILDGGAGNDTLFGGVNGYAPTAGAGNDTYIFGRGYGEDLIYDYDTGAGNVDTIRLKDLNAADVTIKRDADSFYISVNGTSDVLRVADWGLGAAYRIERIEFADGTVMQGQNLVAPFLGTAGNDNLSGTADADVLLGLAGNDSLQGGAGDDVLDGGAGNDTLFGGASGYFPGAGAGNDTYVFGRGYGQDTIYDYDATPGNVDTVRLKDLKPGDVTISRDTSSFYIRINGTSDVLWLPDWGQGSAYRIERIEFADGTVMQGASLVVPFLGTSGNDSMIGTVEADALQGLAGNDTLQGGAGDDVLDGGAGNDTLFGGVSGYFPGAGAGNDTYVFGRGYGQDTIYDYDATPGNVDTVRLKDLNPGDVMISRDTNSFYIRVNGTSDVLRLPDWGLGSAYRIERIEFADGTVMQGASLVVPFMGTASGDSMVGTADADMLLGLAGNDSIQGSAGNDWLDGGAGNDTLFGGVAGYGATAGAGNDTYAFARGYGQDTVYDYDTTSGNLDTIKLSGLNASDVIIRRDAYSMYIEVNGTTDRIRVADWGLGWAARIERIEFADGSAMEGAALLNIPYLGSAGNDNLVGTADNETMRGLAGNDTLAGGAGDDVLDGGDGNDTLKGEDGNDALLGGAGNDTLYAGAGNDLLDGGSGVDKMYGYAGDDVFWVDDINDKVYENPGEGADTVIASIDYTLGSDLENLTLAGTADLNGTGNALANVLRGNSGRNVLSGGAGNDLIDGGAGADTMIGGTGNDIYVVDDPGDTVVENAGEGTDTVQSSVSRALSANVENLILTGNADIDGTGNGLSNAITGNEGANLLAGGDGADNIAGAGGNDYLSGDAGNDTLDGGAGTDVLQGGAGDDVLQDASGVNLLDGGSGADQLSGQGEASFVAGGTGDDRVALSGTAAVVAMNKGDGNDVLTGLADQTTLSLAGVSYEELTLRKDGTNLVIELSGSDSLTLEGWYAESEIKPHGLTLQVMAAAMDGFDASGSDLLLNQSVQQFDLKVLADYYDAVRTEDPTVDRWGMMHKLLDARLAAYDSDALGGELAQAYASNGNLAGVALSSAQATLNAPGFGRESQPLTGVQELQQNSIKLS